MDMLQLHGLRQSKWFSQVQQLLLTPMQKWLAGMLLKPMQKSQFLLLHHVDLVMSIPMTNRFAKLCELGSKGRKYNPLHLEEFKWDNEWVDAACESVHQDAAAIDNDLTWVHVDEASGASQGLRGRNLPRAAVMKRKSISKSNISAAAASKRSKQPRTGAIPIVRIAEDEESREEEDESSGSDYEDDEEDGEGGPAGAFQVDDAVL
jgi:hypothetical protein